MKNTSFEDDYLNILQNIEASIVRVFNANPGLGDLQVDSAIESLIRTYQGEGVKRGPVIPRSDSAHAVYTAIKKVSDWRLGRISFENDEGQSIIIEDPLTMDELIACFKRIRKSIQTWNKRNGSQGYLTYISMFIK